MRNNKGYINYGLILGLGAAFMSIGVLIFLMISDTSNKTYDNIRFGEVIKTEKLDTLDGKSCVGKFSCDGIVYYTIQKENKQYKISSGLVKLEKSKEDKIEIHNGTVEVFRSKKNGRKKIEENTRNVYKIHYKDEIKDYGVFSVNQFSSIPDLE